MKKDCLLQIRMRIPKPRDRQLIQQAEIPKFPTFFFSPQPKLRTMDKEIPLDVALKMIDDQAHYEVRRNVCLAVLLYFGKSSSDLPDFQPRLFGIQSPEL
jgi:hypothetical protein